MTGVNNHKSSWLLSQYFASPNWTEGMDQEHVLGMLSMFYPDVRLPDVSYVNFRNLLKPLRGMFLISFSPKMSNSENRFLLNILELEKIVWKNRDGFTEILGDVLLVSLSICHSKTGIMAT
ncbi:hypothetical protein D4764_13G0002240 [Takifugu flavidus]|uniref:Uncharacterized protein n=1 Tax=Takifugu flavidus TaxID=433684 RepID=A0A5C6P799_9TELE|nr:hypothetical protein D4764_13G0002240 [Takifugu flavidus]